jgi:LytS/YehU family sensor histidine kinase
MRLALIHAGIYGMTFGLTMPALGPRIFSLRPPRSWIVLVSTLVLFSTIASFAIGLVLVTVEPSRSLPLWRGFVVRTLMGSLVSCAVGAAIATYARFQARIGQMSRVLQKREEEKESVLKREVEIRLASLESHLHPHFLFNALASIATLVPEDPERAQRMIRSLADLLRSAIDLTAERVIPLDREMRIVGAYLQIQKERFGDRLLFGFDIDDDAKPLLLPALAIQTLVENCMKHAIEPNPHGGTVHVAAHTAQGKLVVEVIDDGPAFPNGPLICGSGLNNLQTRLNLLFGEEAELSINSEACGARVRLSIPCSVAETHGE